MTLYSADVFDLAKPVSKKGKGKETVPETQVPDIEQEEKKQKRVPTEKQLAALAKAQETRKRKREEAEAVSLATKKQEQEKLEKEEQEKNKKEQKKQEQKEKRRLKKTEKMPATPPPTESSLGSGEQLSLDDSIDHEVKKIKTSIKKNSSSNEPPTWFKQYVSGVKKEEAKISREKKPNKQIQKEAREVAQSSWDDGFTRDRVRNEVDGHMSRMYQMMFNGRRMK